MPTKIFYFTGTGNSLSVAQNIATGMGDTELLSIPKVINVAISVENGDISLDTSKIGLVFPVYMWGMPNIVVEFVRKLELNKKHYIFAVATCAGQPGETLIQLQKLLQEKGADLDAGFAVREASNTIQKDNIFINIARLIERDEIISKSGKERLPEIIEVISRNQKHKVETSSRLLNLYGRWVYSMAMPRINTMGQFFADDNCSLCLTCQRICPSDNIKIVNDKPTWNQNCEFCQACVQWCTKEAIHIKDEDLKRRYHNPEIKVKDIILR
jgi:ferredoxin